MALRNALLGLVERGGKVRTFHVITTAGGPRSDGYQCFTRVHPEYRRKPASTPLLATSLRQHKTVNHSRGEYVRGTAHTNTVEKFWSVFKRGMKGVYQHCGEAHLHRYLAEFDFRYNNRSALGVGIRNGGQTQSKGRPVAV